jgi:tripartite ATP-independent transporter DctM subunit
MTELIALLMFPTMAIALALGFPVALSLMGTAVIFGYIRFGSAAGYQLMNKFDEIATNYILAAVPLFIFMGVMIEKSGIAVRLFDAIHLWTRRIPGGMAIGTIVMCMIFAAASGVVGATESVVGLLAIPPMLKYAYDKGLISGTICAGGSLGTIIPPSVIAVILGPVAQVSVGAIFIAMIIPGFLLAVLYMAYIFVRCTVDPKAGPRLPPLPDEPGFALKAWRTAVAIIPTGIVIFLVLGSIMLGWAAPTEAAALGAFGAIVLAGFYGGLSTQSLIDALYRTAMVSAMILLILLGGTMFAGVFAASGGLSGTRELIELLGFGPWGTLALVLAIAFLLGFMIDPVSIILILIPLAAPILKSFGFDLLWFCIVFMIVLQTSFITPPFAPAIFYLRGISPPEITLRHMYRGVVPFIVIELALAGLVIAYPELATWLPSVLMSK